MIRRPGLVDHRVLSVPGRRDNAAVLPRARDKKVECDGVPIGRGLFSNHQGADIRAAVIGRFGALARQSLEMPSDFHTRYRDDAGVRVDVNRGGICVHGVLNIRRPGRARRWIALDSLPWPGGPPDKEEVDRCALIVGCDLIRRRHPFAIPGIMSHRPPSVDRRGEPIGCANGRANDPGSLGSGVVLDNRVVVSAFHANIPPGSGTARPRGSGRSGGPGSPGWPG